MPKRKKAEQEVPFDGSQELVQPPRQNIYVQELVENVKSIIDPDEREAMIEFTERVIENIMEYERLIAWKKQMIAEFTPRLERMHELRALIIQALADLDIERLFFVPLTERHVPGTQVGLNVRVPDRVTYSREALVKAGATPEMLAKAGKRTSVWSLYEVLARKDGTVFEPPLTPVEPRKVAKFEPKKFNPGTLFSGGGGGEVGEYWNGDE